MNDQRKVAVITGASQGIGAGLVRGYLDHGFRVVANSRSIEPHVSDDLLAIAGDISDPAVAEQVVGQAIAAFGRVDTLLNNAGMFVPNAFTDYTAEEFQRVVNLNLGGFFHVTQHAIRQMLVQGGGHVVNFTTSLVRVPIKSVPSALASLTKGGLDAVTRALAIEYADRKIRVNAVAPGIIRTPMHSPDALADLVTLQPLGRLGEVQEIVDAVLFLERATFVTGETLAVDGGAHAGRW